MKNFEFDVGDYVEYNNGQEIHKAQITHIFNDMFSIPYEVEIEFLDNTLCPPTMRVSFDRIEHYKNPIKIEVCPTFGPIEKVCPKCGTPWHRSSFGHKIWFDCLRCNKRKEDLCG